MAHGTPDWWGESPTATVHQVTDLGELAARLGSLDTFDRRGNVVWLDSFGDGLNKWYLGAVFAHAEVYLSSVKAFHGTYSCKLVTSDQAAGYTWVARSFQPTVESRVGVEVAYQLVDEEVDIELGIAHYTGADEYSYWLKHDTSADILYYRDATPAWVPVLTNVYATTAPTGWNTIKLVVDLEGEEYVRAIFNDQEVPLAGYTCPHTAIGTEAALYVVVLARGDVAATYPVYLDSAIVTQNEP